MIQNINSYNIPQMSHVFLSGLIW